MNKEAECFFFFAACFYHDKRNINRIRPHESTKRFILQAHVFKYHGDVKILQKVATHLKIARLCNRSNFVVDKNDRVSFTDVEENW